MANEITSANLPQAIVRLVADQVLPALRPNFLMANLVNRDWDGPMAQSGDTVSVPIAPVLTANNIAEAGSVTNQNASLGNVSIVLDRHVETSFAIPDVTKLVAKPDLAQVFMGSAALALATNIEQALFGLYPALNVNTAVGSSGVDLTESLIEQAETALFNAQVPMAQTKYLVLNGNQYSKARQLTRFTEMQTSGDSKAIVEGVIGNVKGFQVFRSQLVPRPASTTYNLAFTRDAMVLVSRRLPLPLAGTGAVGTYLDANGIVARLIMSYNPSTLAQQFTLDVLYGVGVLRPEFGIQVQTQS